MLSTLAAASRVVLINHSNQAIKTGPSKSLFSTLTNKSFNNAANKTNNRILINSSRNLRTRSNVVNKAIPIRTTIDHVNTMHNIGWLSVGVAGLTGIGALCYYGLGLSKEESAVERSVLWPKYVKDRIKWTYLYLGSGFGISTAAAVACLRSPAIMRIVSNSSPLFALCSFAAIIASSTLTMNLPYEPGFGPKQMAWIGHCGLVGSMLAPLSMFGGPAIVRAGLYTAGIVGGLSAIAVCAPSERFLISSGPIALGLGVIVASSFGTMFLSPTSRIGLGLYGISMYGGLIVFSGMLLYNTQKTIKRAELHPAYTLKPYDPVNNSLHMYMDIINIFVRLVPMLSGASKK